MMKEIVQEYRSIVIRCTRFWIRRVTGGLHSSFSLPSIPLSAIPAHPIRAFDFNGVFSLALTVLIIARKKIIIAPSGKSIPTSVPRYSTRTKLDQLGPT